MHYLPNTGLKAITRQDSRKGIPRFRAYPRVPVRRRAVLLAAFLSGPWFAVDTVAAPVASPISDELRICAANAATVCDVNQVLKDANGKFALGIILEASDGTDVGVNSDGGSAFVSLRVPVAPYRASTAYMTDTQNSIVRASDIVTFGFILPAPNANTQLVNITLRSDAEIANLGLPPGGAFTINENGDYQNLTSLLFRGGDPVPFSVWVKSDVEPVPLPPAIGMFGAALVGLVGISRRTRNLNLDSGISQ